MAPKVIYFENTSPEIRKMIDSLKGSNEIFYWNELDQHQQDTRLRSAQYFITAIFPISRQIMDKAPCLKFIQKTGSGYDNIDVASATEKGIIVSNTPGANATSVAEMTLGMILSLYRKLSFLDRETKRGHWLMWEHRPHMFEISGKIHGIVGMGTIGRKVAQLSTAFGAKVIYYNRNRLPADEESKLDIVYAPLSELLAAADIVSLHIPLTPESRNMIGAEELRLMKPNALLINLARGNIVDEPALATALKQGQLLGAGIDSWACEPLSPDNPLLELDNVLATPHVGGGTRDVLKRLLAASFANITKIENGMSPDHVVTK
ncbi:MAG TPA: 2-hydroxyacid dehydrogenase [Patescibacteria group bacterium]|nr:2-hydroxyacid dehydrogenase [Patescibacteria group bacterium]